MENKESRHKPMFADVLVSPPTIQSEELSGKNRHPQYLKLVYPNGVTLILPGSISPDQLVEYVKAFRP